MPQFNFLKKRAYFLVSLPLATGALVAQAFGFLFILLAVAAAVGRIWAMAFFHPVFIQPQIQPQPEPTDNLSWIVGVFLVIGFVLAAFSLTSVIMSFRRRESGWRFITTTLLLIYFVSWLPLLFHN